MTYKKEKQCIKCKNSMIVRTSTQLYCKPCQKIYHAEKSKEFYSIKEHRKRRYLPNLIWRRNNLEKKAFNQRKYSKNHPEVIFAHNLIKRNKILPDKSCNICDSTEKLQLHHWNYSKPLLVSTLCINCHMIQHVKNFKNSYFGREIQSQHNYPQ